MAKDDSAIDIDVDEAPTTNGGRQPVERLWDDDGFRQRITERAAELRITVREALIGAGTNSKYMDPSPGGRNTNIAMRVAKFLGLHPAFLMFGVAPADLAPALSPVQAASGANDIQRLALIAQIIASHWLHAALNPHDAARVADTSLQQIALITRRLN